MKNVFKWTIYLMLKWPLVVLVLYISICVNYLLIDMLMICYVYVIICELYDNTYGTMCSMMCVCVCLRYDMIMIQDVNDGWIYIYRCCDMIWNMLWYKICDKFTCLWYHILWCDILWYEMYMMRCYVKNMKRYVMTFKLYVYNMIWMIWNIISLELCMIWELKNEKWYDMNDIRYVKWYDMYGTLAGLY